MNPSTLDAYQKTTDNATLQGYIDFLQRMMAKFNNSLGNDPGKPIRNEHDFALFCLAEVNQEVREQ